MKCQQNKIENITYVGFCFYDDKEYYIFIATDGDSFYSLFFIKDGNRYFSRSDLSFDDYVLMEYVYTTPKSNDIKLNSFYNKEDWFLHCNLKLNNDLKIYEIDFDESVVIFKQFLISEKIQGF
jgi:hypothetical protein